MIQNDTQTKNTEEDLHEQSKPDACWKHVVVWSQRYKKTKQTNKNTLNKNNWASNKDGEKCRKFIERENKTKKQSI